MQVLVTQLITPVGTLLTQASFSASQTWIDFMLPEMCSMPVEG